MLPECGISCSDIGGRDAGPREPISARILLVELTTAAGREGMVVKLHHVGGDRCFGNVVRHNLSGSINAIDVAGRIDNGWANRRDDGAFHRLDQRRMSTRDEQRNCRQRGSPGLSALNNDYVIRPEQRISALGGRGKIGQCTSRSTVPQSSGSVPSPACRMIAIRSASEIEPAAASTSIFCGRRDATMRT